MYRLYAYRHSLAAAANALILAKCLRLHMWDTTRLQTRQLACINRPLAERLSAGGISSLQLLNEADPRRIEAVAKRPFPFGAESVDTTQTLKFYHSTHDSMLALHPSNEPLHKQHLADD